MMSVKPDVVTIPLLKEVGRDDPWGSDEGNAVRNKLLRIVDAHPHASVVRISLAGLRRADTSFLREAVMEFARQLRGRRGVCIVDVPSEDIFENCDAAAIK